MGQKKQTGGKKSPRKGVRNRYRPRDPLIPTLRKPMKTQNLKPQRYTEDI